MLERLRQMISGPQLPSLKQEEFFRNRRRVLFGVGGVVGVTAAATVFGPQILAGLFPKPAREGEFRFGDQPSWLTIDNIAALGQERAKRASDAAKVWDTRYKAERRILISTLDRHPQQNLITPDTLEAALPGAIYIGSKSDSYNITLHAMSHAVRPGQPTLLTNPLPFSDGTIIGYDGLSILVRLDTGEETQFTKIEEGMCERNASAFPGYTVSSRAYFEVGNLARQQFPFDRYPNAHNWVKRNDVPTLIRARLGLSNGTILTAGHHETVMSEYQRAWG